MVTAVIPAKHLRNIKTGQTASICGSAPWYSDEEEKDWEVVTEGWTWENSNGTTGLGRRPVETKEQAEEVMRAVNALSQR